MYILKNYFFIAIIVFISVNVVQCCSNKKSMLTTTDSIENKDKGKKIKKKVPGGITDKSEKNEFTEAEKERRKDISDSKNLNSTKRDDNKALGNNSNKNSSNESIHSVLGYISESIDSIIESLSNISRKFNNINEAILSLTNKNILKVEVEEEKNSLENKLSDEKKTVNSDSNSDDQIINSQVIKNNQKERPTFILGQENDVDIMIGGLEKESDYTINDDNNTNEDALENDQEEKIATTLIRCVSSLSDSEIKRLARNKLNSEIPKITKIKKSDLSNLHCVFNHAKEMSQKNIELIHILMKIVRLYTDEEKSMDKILNDLKELGTNNNEQYSSLEKNFNKLNTLHKNLIKKAKTGDHLNSFDNNELEKKQTNYKEKICLNRNKIYSIAFSITEFKSVVASYFAERIKIRRTKINDILNKLLNFLAVIEKIAKKKDLEIFYDARESIKSHLNAGDLLIHNFNLKFKFISSMINTLKNTDKIYEGKHTQITNEILSNMILMKNSVRGLDNMYRMVRSDCKHLANKISASKRVKNMLTCSNMSVVSEDFLTIFSSEIRKNLTG